MMDVLNALGLKCTRGVSADNCKRHCGKDCYIMVYIYIQKPVKRKDQEEKQFQEIRVDRLKRLLEAFQGKNMFQNYPIESLEDERIGIDYHAMLGQDDGNYIYQPDNSEEITIKNFVPPKVGDPVFSFSEKLLDQACCCSPSK